VIDQEKLRTVFPKMVVKKGVNLDGFSALSLPSYLRDWFLMRYADQNGDVADGFASAKLGELIPGRNEWTELLDKMMNEGAKVKFLAKIKVKLDISRNEVSFALPDLNVGFEQTYIDKTDWERFKNGLLGLEECWGVVSLVYNTIGKFHKIRLVDFSSFRPYKPDLGFYKKAAKQFSFHEWVEVLLGAIDYNSDGFPDEKSRLTLLSRLLPFVEKRLNILELAPKGTGKSYVFSRVSRYGWLNSGGVMSRAKLFYDMHSNSIGLVGNYDYVGLDEISSIRFTDLAEMQGSLKGYLESGSFAVGTKLTYADAGLVFLGNIPESQMNVDLNMTESLPPLFKDSALLDRIHGFIKGWDIPRMDESMKVSSFALNSEYFSSIMHLLRDDPTADTIVNELLDTNKGDTRDITAVKRLSAGFLKLFFPFWETVADSDKDLFSQYCLKPAIEMRSIIKKQLGIIDSEYSGKEMPVISIK
jgi:ATP-dependent Lon protease